MDADDDPQDPDPAHCVREDTMTIREVRELLREVAYKGWNLEACENENFGYLVISFRAVDTDTGGWTTQRGRKWNLSRHMTRSEIIQTAFLAVMTAEEHEIRETFSYRGVPVFGPHLDVEALVEIHGRHDARATPARQTA
jgi:hypothetical protein